MKSWAERRIEVQRERAQWDHLITMFECIHRVFVVLFVVSVILLLARLVLP